MERGGESVAKLNDYAHKRGLGPPQYSDLGFDASSRVFKQSVVFDGKTFPEGEGKSKKEAKHNAAKNALKMLLNSKSKENPLTQPPVQSSSEVCDSPDMEATNFMKEISEYCQQNKFSFNYIEVNREGPSHDLLFYYKLEIDKKDYPVATAKSVKEAKHKAAQSAWAVLQEQLKMDRKASGESVSENQVLEATSNTQTTQMLEELNFISKINEYCQQNNCSHNYIQVNREGSSHVPLFYYKLVINKKEYPVGKGKSVKEARHKAAQSAWLDLQEQLKVDKGSGEFVSEDQVLEATSNAQVTHILEETNFISKINEYCQQNNCSHNYIQVNKEGSSHDPLFYYKLVIDETEYPVGKGKTVKEARQKAAESACSVLLKAQLSLDSKLSDWSSGSDESGLLAQHRQSNSGSSWIRFEGSSKSNSQITPDPDAVTENNSGNSLPKTSSSQSKIHLEYDCLEPIGNGAYGCVYKARDKEIDKYFAIKEIQPKDLNKSKDEAKVLADLLHTNIVRYYNCWSDNTGYRCSSFSSNSKFLFIVMELCDGGTLRRWIHEKNKESIKNSRRDQSLKIALQILSGVEYIHSNKLIHRDLKPENILFGQDGNVRIGDFGLVTQDNDEGEIVERTEARGTPSYMAPEQFGVNYDCKVDIFALGLIFFELLWRISTGHERVMIWPDVRRQIFPKEFTETYTIESHTIKMMLREKPEARPEASELKPELEKWISKDNNDQGNQTI